MLSDAPPQFSMDEAGGNFRIATTFGEMWASPPTSTSGVYVFDPAGLRIGEVCVCVRERERERERERG